MVRLRDGQRGQALVLSLIVLTVGGILVVPLLSYVSTVMIGSRVFEKRVLTQYATDAGVEDAIWRLKYTTLASDSLGYSGATTSYALPESVNASSPTISITRDYEQHATDDFESAGWNGGTGWLAGWTNSGDSAVTTAGTPFGLYNLRLRTSTGYVKRPLDLSGKANVWLEFQARVSSFEGSDSAVLSVSPDGSTWTNVKTWTTADSDGAYHEVRVDLSPYTLTSSFWIAFQANMNSTGDQFYVDNIVVLSRFPQTRVGLPAEDFESGNWSGGTGWLAGWTHSGDSAIVTTGTAHTGSRHLRLRTSTGYARRPANLSGASNLRLQFWAKVNSFEGGDQAIAQVSSNGTNWTTVATWTSANSDSAYHFVDIDLTPYTMSSMFWIAFDANMSATNDLFYVDDLALVATPVYEIESASGNRSIRADVRLVGGTVQVWEWQTK